MDYSIFPYWMGINGFGSLIGTFICFLLLFFLYSLFGYALCPNSLKTRIPRLIFILFWPIFIIIGIIIFPFYMLYEFTKPPEQTKKELNEFIKEEYNRYK